jgi:hypothetical protein
MSIQGAINFISRVDSDNEFRKECYSHKTQSELLSFTASEGMKFNADEIEDAFNVLELKCQTYEQAGRVHEVKAWFRLFQKDE